jgi:PhnB protein
MQIAPHLHFKGNCREAFKYYAEAFDGKIVFEMSYGESPVANQVPAEERTQIIHARVDIGGQYLLGMDASGSRYQTPQGFHVQVAVEKPDQAERIFKALSQGGTITMPFQQTFWAHRFGMCTDRFGIPWMINCEKAS